MPPEQGDKAQPSSRRVFPSTRWSLRSFGRSGRGSDAGLLRSCSGEKARRRPLDRVDGYFEGRGSAGNRAGCEGRDRERFQVEVSLAIAIAMAGDYRRAEDTFTRWLEQLEKNGRTQEQSYPLQKAYIGWMRYLRGDYEDAE